MMRWLLKILGCVSRKEIDEINKRLRKMDGWIGGLNSRLNQMLNNELDAKAISMAALSIKSNLAKEIERIQKSFDKLPGIGGYIRHTGCELYCNQPVPGTGPIQYITMAANKVYAVRNNESGIPVVYVESEEGWKKFNG